MAIKTEVFTFCWNEMAILPFCVDYWKRYASHVTVYDNQSTDGSDKFLSQFDFVTVKTLDTGNMKNDCVLWDLKNNMWKEARGRADLVVICDMDEMLIPIDNQLDRFYLSGATICSPIWYDTVGDEVPQYDGRYLHHISPYAMYNPASKAVLFNPNKITEMNYTAGAHQCRPTGDVKWGGNAIYLLHTNNALSLDYRLTRYKQQAARRCEEDIRKGHAIHYTFSEEKLRHDWQMCLNQRIDFGALLSE